MKLHPIVSRSGIAIAIGATLLSACSDQAEAPLAPGGASASLSASAPSEEAALSELTRMVALSLQDNGLRQRIRNDLRDSRHTTEHKLALTNYVNGQSGGILLAKMAKESGMSREDVLALIGSVRPLEFYLPVATHRESWRAGDNLIVASLLEDEPGVVGRGFTLSGAPVQLVTDAAPTTPVLALVPVETDFSRTLDTRQYRNTGHNGGQSVGTMMIEPGQDCEYMMGGGSGGETTIASVGDATIMCGGGGGDVGGGGGGTVTPPTKPGGLYMTYSNLNNDGEAWLKGAPEIEVHIHGPNGGDKTYGADLACAGDRQTDPHRKFNQDNNTWSGEVLLFNQVQINSYNASYPGMGFNVMMWEDDDGACAIKTDKNMTLVLAGIAGVIGAAAVVIAEPSPANFVKASGLFIAALYASASWLLSNDDFLGAAPQVTQGAVRTDLYTSSSSTNGYINTQLKYMQ